MKDERPILLHIKDAVIGYPEKPVLRGISLVLRKGDFFPLAGVNGSGKSTLLKTVVGILKPLSGTIEYGINGRTAAPRIGYLPQAERLDPIFPLSVRDVVRMGTYGLLRPGLPMSRELREWAQACLRETGTEQLAGTPFSVLSNGQKQRVLLARALANRPELLVLDEPTSGIDIEGERGFLELIRRVNRSKGVAVLLATHNERIVGDASLRVLRLHEGRTDMVEARTAFRGGTAR